MWKAMFQLARPTLKRHWPSVGVVAAGGFVTGIVATSKSFLESSILQLVANAVSNHKTDGVWSMRIDTLSASDSSLAGRLTTFLFSDRPLLDAIGFYALLSAAGATLIVGLTVARERITQTLFVSMYTRATDSATLNALDEHEWGDEPGGLAGAIQPGASSVSQASSFMIDAVQYLFALGAILITVAQVGWKFALGFLALVVIFVALTKMQAFTLKARRETFDKKRSRLYADTAEMLDIKEVLLAHERKDLYLNRVESCAQELADIDRKLAVSESRYSSVVNVVNDVGRVGTLVLVLYLASSGSPIDKVGDAYFYVSLFGRIVAPVLGILNGLDHLYGSVSSSRTLLELLKVEAEKLPAGSEWVENYSGADAISVDDVSISYSPAEPVLVGCTFRVPRGGVTLVLGPSGTGKTTLARMMLGFVAPDAGVVAVNGLNVERWDPSKLLLQMSYAAQTRHVISATVKENLFVEVERPEDELARAIVSVGLADTIKSGRDFLTRSAADLSEGQKQRLALARILVDRAPIVILDEPMSGVDARTFDAVKPALSEWLDENRQTVVLISHRLAFASFASHVVVLGPRGAVLEQGDPRALANTSGSHFAEIRRASIAELSLG